MLNCKDFDVILSTMEAEERLVGQTKAKEYAPNEDRLENFRKLASDLGLTMEQILWVYLRKHLDAISTYCRLGYYQSEENIEGRIKDARVYLSLLRAMVEEKKFFTPKAEKEI